MYRNTGSKCENTELDLMDTAAANGIVPQLHESSYQVRITIEWFHTPLMHIRK